jgi:hypothetical protein
MSEVAFVEKSTMSLPLPLGLPTIARLAFDGADLNGLRTQLAGQYAQDANPALLLDLSTVDTVLGNSESARHLQLHALSSCRLFSRDLAGTSGRSAVHLLVVMATGDLMANTPLEFLLEDSGITLHYVFCRPGEVMPAGLPGVDAVFVAVGQSDEHQSTLHALAQQLSGWPLPVLNHPAAIAQLTRSGVAELLAHSRGLTVPRLVRVDRAQFITALPVFAGGFDAAGQMAHPVLARPTHSHAGQGLQRLATQAQADAYLAAQPEDAFFLCDFIDYSRPDSLFRKYRIAFIDGVAYPSHMAISSHWMIHYLNAGMTEDAAKRAEEAAWMASFDTDFARRHQLAFGNLCSRLGLDYFVIDCAETQSGDLLIFEVDTAMLVHAMDHPDLFAYKQQPMQRLFAAMQAMIRRRATMRGHGPRLC